MYLPREGGIALVLSGLPGSSRVSHTLGEGSLESLMRPRIVVLSRRFCASRSLETQFVAVAVVDGRRRCGAPKREVVRKGDGVGDVARAPEFVMVRSQIVPRHAHVDVVREVPSSVVGHEPKAREPRLTDIVRRESTIAGLTHPTVFGNGA